MYNIYISFMLTAFVTPCLPEGRGNFVNHHSGNEQFRKLVQHHKHVRECDCTPIEFTVAS